MKYERKEQFEKINVFGTGTANTAYAQFFIGNSFLNPLTDPKGGLFAANVTFEPGCRNNWHIHHADKGGGQLLICTAGEGWYQEEGKAAVSLYEGSVVMIPANVKHWHGAKKDSWFSHIAVEVPGEYCKNAWCEPVSDEKYKGDALIQKNFTVDFMSKKRKKNEGELPKYYVTGGHEAIIPPPLHEYIQVEMLRRLDYEHGRYSGVHPFLGRIICENCGAAYRYSSWHSTTYNDWVWECSSRWRGQKCGNHHIYATQFQTLLQQVMAMAISQRTDMLSELNWLIKELPNMTAERYTLIAQALCNISDSVYFAQADAIIAVKTIHIGLKRTMRVTFLDDSEIIIDVPPFTPRKK